MAGWKKGVAAFAIVVITVVTGFSYVKWELFDSYVNTIAVETGMSSYLVKALAAVLLIPFHLGIYYALQFWSRRKRWTGFATLIALYVLYNVGLYLATRDHYRGKWYVKTPEGIVYYDRRTESGTDPVYGLDLKPVTPEKLPELIALEKGCNTVDPGNIDFFNSFTGNLNIWYYQRSDGTYEFFDGPCHHPQLGVLLKSVTRSVAEDWEDQEATRETRTRPPRGGPPPGEGWTDSPDNISEQSGGDGRRLGPTGETNQVPAPDRRRNTPARDFMRQHVNERALERMLGEDTPVSLIAFQDARTFEEALAQALRRRGINAHTGVLKPEVLQSGDLLRQLAGGDEKMQWRLGLAQLSGHLVLGRLSFSEMRALRRGFRTRAQLSVTLVPLAGGQPVQRAFEARGSGFEEAAAREQALERVQSDFLQSSLAGILTRQ